MALTAQGQNGITVSCGGGFFTIDGRLENVSGTPTVSPTDTSQSAFRYDEVANLLYIWSPTASLWEAVSHTVPTLEKSFTIIDPTSTESLMLLTFDVDITVVELTAVLKGASGGPSVTWTIRHDADVSSVGTEIVTGGTATVTVGIPDSITSFNNPSIPAGSGVWIETTAQSGTTPQLSITMKYTED